MKSLFILLFLTVINFTEQTLAQGLSETEDRLREEEFDRALYQQNLQRARRRFQMRPPAPFPPQEGFRADNGETLGKIRPQRGPELIEYFVDPFSVMYEQNHRIRMLEEAVMILQTKIFELDGYKKEKKYRCEGEFFKVGKVVGEKWTSSLDSAKNETIRVCEKAGGSIFCEIKDIKLCTEKID